MTEADVFPNVGLRQAVQHYLDALSTPSCPPPSRVPARVKAKHDECKKYVDHVARLEEQYKWVLAERDSFGQRGDFDFGRQDPKQVWGGEYMRGGGVEAGVGVPHTCTCLRVRGHLER